MLVKTAIFFVISTMTFVFLMFKTRSGPKWPAQNWFEKLIGPENGDSAASFFKILASAVFIVIVVFGVAVVSLLAKAADYGIDKLGTFGDFIGGVVNPLLTFLTFLGLLITIVIQQREVAQARSDAKDADYARKQQSKAQEKQNFEATFFQMLAVHNSIVNSMDIQLSRSKALAVQPTNPLRSMPRRQPLGIRGQGQRSSQGDIVELKARDCFDVFVNELKEYYATYRADDQLTEEERLSNAYARFWLRHQGDLGHYFRYLYNVVRFIDERTPPSDRPDQETMRYMKLLRAQLSDQELFMLFYNCLADLGHKFKKYAEKYSLLDNLPPGAEISIAHRSFFENTAFDESAWKKPVQSGDTVLVAGNDE